MLFAADYAVSVLMLEVCLIIGTYFHLFLFQNITIGKARKLLMTHQLEFKPKDILAGSALVSSYEHWSCPPVAHICFILLLL